MTFSLIIAGRPVVLRPVRATPCLKCGMRCPLMFCGKLLQHRFFSFSSVDNSMTVLEVYASVVRVRYT